MAKETGMHKAEVRSILDALFNTIIENVALHKRVNVGGLGTFHTRVRHGGFSAKDNRPEYRLPRFTPTQWFMNELDPIQYGDYTDPPERTPIYRY
jgi:nucleoid DNA-binding protein